MGLGEVVRRGEERRGEEPKKTENP